MDVSAPEMTTTDPSSPPADEPTEQRKLFSEISPLTYELSVRKERLKRHLRNLLPGMKLAKTRSDEVLPVLIMQHQSLIRRRLKNVDMQLQENKAVNLGLTTPKVTKVLVRPGETFSFWRLVGNPSGRKGYLAGLTASNGKPSSAVGGGLCQFTNLLHWMVLHTDLEIVEHHHHNGLDLFPDFNRQIPFGTGTSIFYNYLDYQIKNTSEKTYQIIVYTTDEYLCGEIRCSEPLDIAVHIREEEFYFYEQAGQMIRHNKIYRQVVDKATGDIIEDKLLLENNAVVMYDRELINKDMIRESPESPLAQGSATENPPACEN